MITAVDMCRFTCDKTHQNSDKYFIKTFRIPLWCLTTQIARACYTCYKSKQYFTQWPPNERKKNELQSLWNEDQLPHGDSPPVASFTSKFHKQ